MTQTVKTLLFAAAAVVVAAVAFFARPSAPAIEAAFQLKDGFFPDFKDPLAAVSMEVVKFDAAIAAKRPFKVAQQNGLWVIPSHENYPADASAQMKEAAALLIGLRPLGAVSGDKAEHVKFGVADPGEVSVGSQGVGTLVRMSDKEGRDLARIIIGDPVKDQPDQHYVRIPGEDRVYVAAISDRNLSTNFADWIERDLLQLDQFDIRQIKIDNYSIDETRRARVQGDTLELSTEGSGDKGWTLKGLKEEEELNKKKLDDLRAAIDNLNIVGVERKPALLVNNLRAGRELFKDMDNPANRVIYESLLEKGFYAMPVEVLGKQDWMIFSNEGELVVGLQNGIEYVLRFGEITEDDDAKDTATKAKDDQKKEEKKDGKDGDAKSPAKPKKTGSNRHMYVVARVNEGLIKKPELLTVPEYKDPPKPDAPKPDAPKPDAPKPDAPKPDSPKPEAPKPDAPKPDGPKPSDDKKPGCEDPSDVKKAGETKTADKNRDDKKSDEKKDDEKKPDASVSPVPPVPPPTADAKAAHEAMAKAITSENERRQKEYEAKIEDARKRVTQLNARFAEWYYIISDAEFQKMRLTRKDVVGPNKALLNKRDGDAFLAANKTKEGIITTASGLQYKVIKEGAGKTPKATDQVAVAYKGTLIDGTVFDESKPGMPAEFSVDGVIAGWTEALQLMKEGGKLQLFIPGELAYKEKGSGDKIGPNQVLIFDVELVKVK